MSDLKQEQKSFEELIEASLDSGNFENATILLSYYQKFLAGHFHAESAIPRYAAYRDRIFVYLMNSKKKNVGSSATQPSPKDPARPRAIGHLITRTFDYAGHTNALINIARGLNDYYLQFIIIPDHSHRFKENNRLKNLVRSSENISIYSPKITGRLDSIRETAFWINQNLDVLIWHADPYDIEIQLITKLASVKKLYLHHPAPYLWLTTGQWDCDIHIDVRPLDASYCRKRAPKQYSGRIESIENGVREISGKRDDSEIFRTHGLKSRKYVLTVSSGIKLLDNINQSIFLENVVSEILRIHEDFKFVLIGHPNKHLSTNIQKLPDSVKNRILSLGRVRNLSPFYLNAACYLDPLPVGSGLSLLESLSAGIPVVALKQQNSVHTYEEALDENQIAHTIEDYVQKTSSYIKDTSLGETTGNLNRNRYLSRYSLKATGTRYRKVIDELLDKKKESPPSTIPPISSPASPAENLILRTDLQPSASRIDITQAVFKILFSAKWNRQTFKMINRIDPKALPSVLVRFLKFTGERVIGTLFYR